MSKPTQHSQNSSIIIPNTLQSKPSSKPLSLPKKWHSYGILVVGVFLLVVILHNFFFLYDRLIYLVSQIENPYSEWLGQQNTSNPLVLIPLAFIGGLLASVSPCILSLLPVNLSYIGTLNITSRRDAFVKASQFVVGVITIFSLFGLFASFASAVLVDYRGGINIVVGTLILLMGLSFVGIFHIPLPHTNISLPFASPYGVGLTFALISSPCASPVLFAVIAAAAATGSAIVSTLTLISYGFGYTAVIFLASLFTGLVKQSRTLLSRSEWVIRIGGAALILSGGYYLINGINWFI